MDVTKTIQELLLSKDTDNYKIASQILNTYPIFIITTMFIYEEDDPLILYWGDGDIGDSNGGGHAPGGMYEIPYGNYYGTGNGNGGDYPNGDGTGDGTGYNLI
jgi:hypothetical protein